MPTPQQVLLGLILPAVVAAVLTAVGWASGKHRGSWGTILGISIGFLLAFYGIMGQWPPLPPTESPQRIALLAVPLGVLAAILSLPKVHGSLRILLAIAAPAGAVWFMFKALPAASFPPSQMLPWVGGATAVAVAVELIIEPIALKYPSTAPAMILGPLAGGVSVIALLMVSQNLGYLGAAVALMVLGSFFARLLFSPAKLSRGPVVVVVTLLTAILTYAFFESDEISTTEVILLAGAPLLAWIVELPPIRRIRPWRRELLRMILVTIPIVVAIVLAAIQFQKDNSPPAI